LREKRELHPLAASLTNSLGIPGNLIAYVNRIATLSLIAKKTGHFNLPKTLIDKTLIAY